MEPNLLERPERISGLPTLRPADRTLRLWRTNPDRSWTVYRDGLVRRVQAGPARRVTGADGFVPGRELSALLAELEALTLPAFAAHPAPTDGPRRGLERGDGARLTWQGAPPAGWDGLAAWFDRAISTFEAHLPEEERE